MTGSAATAGYLSSLPARIAAITSPKIPVIAQNAAFSAVAAAKD